MDLAVSDGDFVLDENGRPVSIQGAEELFQRARIRLRVPLGAFSCDPKLGSRLFTLKGQAGASEEKALSLAREALAAMPQVEVLEARYLPGDAPRAAVTLACNGTRREWEVEL